MGPPRPRGENPAVQRQRKERPAPCPSVCARGGGPRSKNAGRWKASAPSGFRAPSVPLRDHGYPGSLQGGSFPIVRSLPDFGRVLHGVLPLLPEVRLVELLEAGLAGRTLVRQILGVGRGPAAGDVVEV